MSAASPLPASRPAYRHPAEAVVASLATDAQRGLGQSEARVRLERHGRNELMAEQPVPAWRKFLGQFRDVLVILLLESALQTAEAALTGESLPVEKTRWSSTRRSAPAIATTWSSVAPRQPTGTGARWWWRQGCRPRWAASPAC